MVRWSDSFWGEGNRGFEVLSSNVKNGAIAIEEFQRFLNESAQCESTYCKNLSRLQSQLIKTQHVGTFTPIWNLIRDLTDKITSTHLITLNHYQELIRDIHNYQELYQKKFKAHIQKDGDITRIVDLITQLNSSLNTVNKAKEQYHSVALDYERSKRGGSNWISTSSVPIPQDNNPLSLHSFSFRHGERLEKKYRLAQDDYKLTIEKYNVVRNDFEKRLHDACTKFQDFEIEHIERMLVLSLNYSDLLQRNNEQIRTAQNEFNDKLKALTGNDLLDAFVEQKKTGIDRPVVLQFEELDNLKSPMQVTNIVSPDLTGGQDDLNFVDQSESGIPSFQVHFPIPPSNSKPSENTRALSPNADRKGTSSPPINDSTMSPPSNNSSTSAPSMNSNNRLGRSNSCSEQTVNPFDLKKIRPKFPGFFGTNRKEKKEKKNEKKPPVGIKSGKTFQKQHSRDESTAGNNNGTPESHTQSSPSISNDDANRHGDQTTNPFSSKISKSSSSSDDDDDDDDDDDNPMVKMNFKINPKAETSVEGDDETTIMNAMRRIDKNIGNLATNSKELSHKRLEMSKSISSGIIGTRILPRPPIPYRPATTTPNNVTADNIDQSNAFPPLDQFDRSPWDFTSVNSTNQENLSIPPQSAAQRENSPSISPTEDDTEVANSFPNGGLSNKTTPFPILQAPSLLQSNQEQRMMTRFSPSIASMSPNLSYSPIVSNEQGMSPLTIGAIDQIPLAVAFQELIHVIMRGNKQENWKSQIVGEMLISFPASMINLLADSSYVPNTLEFRLKNFDNIKNIIIKSSSVTQNESIYSFDMTALHHLLRNLQEKNPSSRFYNLAVLSYEVNLSDVSNIPIQISSQWTRTFDTISVNINYRFNSSALPESIRLNNDAVIFYTIITDGEQIKESSPTAEWSANDHKLWWKVPYINNGTGSLSATVMTKQVQTVENDSNQQPLTTSSIITVHFLGENALFSLIDFDLACRGYRVSLLKKKILSGKYQFEPDENEPIHLFQRPAQPPPSVA